VRGAAPVTQSAFCTRSQPLFGHKDWAVSSKALPKIQKSRGSRGATGHVPICEQPARAGRAIQERRRYPCLERSSHCANYSKLA
jgi:hypothetical protein